jgi:hypothetical protein
MSLMDILAAAQGGGFFASIAQVSGTNESQAKAALSAICPAIASRLRDKAETDAEAFEALLDLLEDGGNSSDLDDPAAITGAEAVADGEAVLKDLYGSDGAAQAAMKSLAPGLPAPVLAPLSAIGATSVLAALAKTYSAPQTLSSGTASAGGGILGTILSAVVAGLVKGAARQMAPKHRRRRSYGSYYSPRRRTRRRRTATPSLNDVFGSILGRR